MSRLVSIFLNPRKYIQYAFDLSLYPTNMPFFSEGSSFVLFSLGTCMYIGQVKFRDGRLLVSFLRKLLLESCYLEHGEVFCSVHTRLFLLLLPISAKEGLCHEALPLLLPL